MCRASSPREEPQNKYRCTHSYRTMRLRRVSDRYYFGSILAALQALQRKGSIEVKSLSTEGADDDRHGEYNILGGDKGDMGSQERSGYRGVGVVQS